MYFWRSAGIWWEASPLHSDKMLTTEQGSGLWRYLQGLSRFWKPVSCQRSWSAVPQPCARQQPRTSEFVLAGQTVSCSVLKWHLVFVQGSDPGLLLSMMLLPYSSLLQGCASNSHILLNLIEHRLFHRIHVQYENNESPGFRSIPSIAAALDL